MILVPKDCLCKRINARGTKLENMGLIEPVLSQGRASAGVAISCCSAHGLWVPGFGGRMAAEDLRIAMADLTDSVVRAPDGADHSRRKFLVIATTVYAAVGAAFTAVPFIESWLPSESARALGGPTEVDISKVDAGQMIVVGWRRHPIFILHRTPAQLQTLRQSSDIELLRDPNSEVDQQPDYARNWHRSIKPEYLIVVGICTHLGCVPRYVPAPGGNLGPSWPGGYFCPCHGSRYDLSARVFKGVPAPYNLPVPPHRFVSTSVLRIGENPPGTHFDFSSIAQV
jgi:ubiquinol-cytochrome c reductase iron-sulfur subunit